MNTDQVILITGTRKGIGEYLVRHYVAQDFQVIGCSRKDTALRFDNYEHFCLDVADEHNVKNLFIKIRKVYGRLDALINNAGIASMNHALLTPIETARRILETNVIGTFLFCREAAKLMQTRQYGRIVNFSSVAVPLKLEGEAIYASSKAAIVTLTQVLAKELAPFNITVNAIGPSPVETDLIKAVPEEKIRRILNQQAIPRYASFIDISNVIDFFLKLENSFVTGQVLYLGGV